MTLRRSRATSARLVSSEAGEWQRNTAVACLRMRRISLGRRLERVTLKIHRNMLRIITDRLFRVIELRLRAAVRSSDLAQFLQRAPFIGSVRRMAVWRR